MLFRILFFFVIVLLVGCGQKSEPVSKNTASANAVFSGPVSLKTYSVMDSTRLNDFFDLDNAWSVFRNRKFSSEIDKVLKDVRKLTVRENQQIYYKVCFSDVDGFVLRHPCSLDSSLLVSLVKKLNYNDSLKGVKVKVDFMAYSESDEYAEYSEIYLNEDGSLESECLAKDGLECDNLYVHVSVSKKLFPENVLAELLVAWPTNGMDVRIEESDVIDKYRIEDVFSSIYETRLASRFIKENESSIIPFEMCYANGFAIPCDLSKKAYFRVKKLVENEGDTLVAVTYQKSLMIDDFALGGVSSKHFCVSQDGKRCSELYALVRRNDNAEDKKGFLVLYRFDLKDFSFVVDELDHADHLMVVDYNSLLKKDGTYIGRVKKR